MVRHRRGGREDAQGSRPVARDLDDIGRLDERTQEVFIDERAFRKMLSGRVSADVEEMLVDAGRREKDSRLRSNTTGLKKVPWGEVASRIDTFREAPIVRVAEGEDLDRAIASARRQAEQEPELARIIANPAPFFEAVAAAAGPPGSAPALEHHIHAFSHELIDCYSRRTGTLYWVAAGVILAIVIAGLIGFVLIGFLYLLLGVLHIAAILALKRCWDELHGAPW